MKFIPTSSTAYEEELAEFIGGFYADPLGFVTAVFPWGDTHLPDGRVNPLRNRIIEEWQKDFLNQLGDHIKENVIRAQLGLDLKPWRSAWKSGHGVGKSALVSWLIYFFMSTRVDTRGVVTANTQPQLQTKTWPELGKWHDLAIHKHWFEWTATAFTFAKYPPEKRRNYMIDAQTVSAENTEAFQGLHNEGKTIVLIMDEASGIIRKLWEVAHGAMTDGEAFQIAFGNPTAVDSAFYDCFNAWAKSFKTGTVDSRSVSFSNKLALSQTIAMYGENSNEVRVRIYGEFPDVLDDGFFSISDFSEAFNRPKQHDRGAALIMMVDLARFGPDMTYIGFRQGRDGWSYPLTRMSKCGTIEVADKCCELALQYKPDIIVTETSSYGLTDVMRSRNFKITEINPGTHLTGPHYNVRARNHDKFRNWLRTEGMLKDNQELVHQGVNLKYRYGSRSGTAEGLLIESKAEIKARNLPSPDLLDMWTLSFGVPAGRRDDNWRKVVAQLNADRYDPIDYAERGPV